MASGGLKISKQLFVDPRELQGNPDFIPRASLAADLPAKSGSHLEVAQRLLAKASKAAADPHSSFDQLSATESVAIQRYLSPATLHLDGHVGRHNEWHFFSSTELSLVKSAFFIEDILYARLLRLAELTCNIVFDEEFAASGVLDEEKESENEFNSRFNPQFHDLREFYWLLNHFDYFEANREYASTEDVQAFIPGIDPYDQESIEDYPHVEFTQEIMININSESFGEMRRDLAYQLVLNPKLISVLKSSAKFYLSPKNIKNATMYIDYRTDQEYEDLPEARVSYRYYTNRFPQLLGLGANASNFDLHYDASSIHFKELNFFDEMVQKINDEKRIWPGLKLGENLPKEPEEALPDNSTAGQCASDSEDAFEPAFGSFQKEMLKS